jgi:hypothetical protein
MITITTTTPGIRLRLEEDGNHTNIITEEKTPAGFEQVDLEKVPSVLVREILTEWYDVSPEALEKLGGVH